MEQRRPNQNQNQNLPDPEKRKKIFLWLVVFIAVFSVIFFSVSYLKKYSSDNEKKETAENRKSALPKMECNFSNDQAVMQKAKDSQDPMVCLCIKDEQTKFRCQEDAQNLIAFSQARDQFNADLCILIKNDSSLKDACESMVVSGIEYLKKEAPEHLAYVFSQNGNYDQAIEILENSTKIANDVKVMLALALTYAGKGLMEHRESEFVPKAMNLAEKAISIEPQNPETYRVQGYVYEVKPDLSKSIESYNKSLEKNPSYALAFAGRGHAYNLMGNLNKALEDFKKAAELDKKMENIFTWVNLCRLQVSRDDLLAEGIKNCQIVLASSLTGAETKSETHQILADAYIREKKYEQASIELESARAFSPRNPNLLVTLAKLHTEQGDYVAAITESQEALSIDALKTAAYYSLAYAYFKSQEYIQAETQALKGLEVIKKDPSLLLSSKPYYEKQLNYLLADISATQGNQAKEAQYRKTVDNIIKSK